MVGSLKMNTALEYSTRVVQEGDRRWKKSTLSDLAYLTPLRIPLMNPVLLEDIWRLEVKQSDGVLNVLYCLGEQNQQRIVRICKFAQVYNTQENTVMSFKDGGREGVRGGGGGGEEGAGRQRSFYT